MNKRFLLGIVVFLMSLYLSPNDTSAYCNHIWVLDESISYDATCSEEGVRWYDCSKCYEYKTEKIPATGIHKWSEWKADGHLCENGKYTRECKECYKEESKPRASDGNHMYSEWQIIQKADCVNNGKKYRYCYTCYNFWYEDIPSTPNVHNWGIWHINYLKNKRIERTCYSCGKVEVKKVTIYPTKKTLKKGKSFSLTVRKHTSGDAVSKYTSSNKKVATVSKKGKVKAKKKGKATITVKMKSGCKATCKVTVK